MQGLYHIEAATSNDAATASLFVNALYLYLVLVPVHSNWFKEHLSPSAS